jgi:hypothetical protein
MEGSGNGANHLYRNGWNLGSSHKAPIKEIIRQNAAASADEILNGILTALNRFRQGLEPEDDVTLVVIKVTDDAGST